MILLSVQLFPQNLLPPQMTPEQMGKVVCVYSLWAASNREVVVLRRAKHARHLLAGKTSAPPLLGPRDSLDRAGFLHQGWVELGRHTGDDAVVVAGEFGRRDGHRGGPPEVVGRVAQVYGNLGWPGRCGEPGGRAVGDPDGGKPGEPG